LTPEPPRGVWQRFWEGTFRLIEEGVPSLALFVMFLVIVYQVFMRDVLTKPPTWSDELARYLYIYLVFLGAALISRKRAHIRMDFLPTRLHGRARALLLLAHEIFIIAFLLYAFRSALVFYDFYRRIPSPAMEIPSGYLVVVLPFACVLMLIHHGHSALGLIRSLRAR
jgi:TRAP-type C4-dicarboxylate transport system permease small subunit